MKTQFTERSERKLLSEFVPSFWQKGILMYCVYVLQSESSKDKIYLGYTDDLERRLAEHNSGKNYSTRNDKPYRIVYYEAYLNKLDAIDRENKLKHHGSVTGHLKKRIKRSLTN